MDWFALGGILIDPDDIGLALDLYRAFVGNWGIDYPLHSAPIRGHRKSFRWLGRDRVRAERFYRELGELLVALPVIGTACVVDRPGYNARYAETYGDQRWLMCKTAYAILVERAVKFARSKGSQLEVFFEQAGRDEDRNLIGYHRELKRAGMPFDEGRSSGYSGLSPDEFRAGLLGDPSRLTKQAPLMQIADLYLYPMVKAGYQPYDPFERLVAAERVIDALLPEEERASLGIKYSCFDLVQNGERPGG